VRQNSQLQALLSWQRGEAGRREGERYERDVVRRAGVLFNGATEALLSSQRSNSNSPGCYGRS
jgi:hypothetical protein